MSGLFSEPSQCSFSQAGQVHHLCCSLAAHSAIHAPSTSLRLLRVSLLCDTQNYPTWCETVVRVRGGDHAKDHRDYTEGVWVRFASNHLPVFRFQ